MVLKYSSLSYPESDELYELYEYQWWILYSLLITGGYPASVGDQRTGEVTVFEKTGDDSVTTR